MKFYSFIIFSLLNCLVLILNLYMHFLPLNCYFLNLNIIWTLTLLGKHPDLCIVSLLLYLNGVGNYFPRLWGIGISGAIFTTSVASIRYTVFHSVSKPQKLVLLYPQTKVGDILD